MKNLIKISILTFLQITICISSLLSQQGWSIINTTFGGDVYFKDVNTGIVGCYKTTNGGINWVQTNGCGKLSFPTPNTGYAVGTDIYKTTNFGDNWITQQNPVPGNLYGISFPTVNTGYACGGNYIIKTTNGGNNWIVLNPPLNAYTSVFFIDSLKGYFTGGGDTNIVLKTTNGGSNWIIYRFNDNFDISSIFFVNSNTGIVAGGNNYYSIYKTTNEGNNWINIPSPTLNYISSLYFSSTNTGYGVCSYGDIIKTTDGGWTWFKQTPVTGNNLYSVFFINDNTGYASGTNAVLKTTNGGGPPIGIEPISNEVPDKFSLFQNYPNPFNPVTKIKFETPPQPSPKERGSKVKLIVYDVTGRDIAILVNEQLPAGTYEVEWDGTNYPSGVYFYRLEVRQAGSSTGDFAETKKMVLIK